MLYKCPQCGNDDPAHLIGINVHGIYDGVLYWVCGVCDWAWPRDFGDWERRNAQSQQYVDEHNSGGARTSVGPPE